MGKFAILLGGDIVVTNRLRDQVSGRCVIAADSGIRHARPLELDVDLWVGDFDSASAIDLHEFASTPREKWPSDKDKSDGEIALDIAVTRGTDSVVVVGAFGGRTVHATNHLLMAFGMGIDVTMTSGKEEAVPLVGPVSPDWPDGTVFSVLAIDDLTGLTVEGAQWPLKDVSVACGSSWTLSNVVAGRLSTSVKSGRALLLGELA